MRRKSEAEISKEMIKKESNGSKNGPSNGRALKAGARRYRGYRENGGRTSVLWGTKEGGGRGGRRATYSEGWRRVKVATMESGLPMALAHDAGLTLSSSIKLPNVSSQKGVLGSVHGWGVAWGD